MVQRRIIKIIISLFILILFIISVNNLVYNIKNIDRDGDNLTDKEEKNLGTNCFDVDSDDDGFTDYDEYKYWENRSNEKQNHTFIKYWKDFWNKTYNKTLTDEELKKFLLPTGDVDNDGLINICDIDSDNDNKNDYFEILNNSDPAFPESDSDSLNDPDNNNNNGGGDNNGSEEKDLSSTKTTISVISSDKIYKTDYFYVKGYVIDGKDQPVTNITVEIFVNKTKNENGSFAGKDKVTLNGSFNITCVVPKDSEVGSNHIVAHSIGNDEFDESWSDPLVNIYSDTKINLDILDSVGQNQSFQIKGEILDIEDKPLNLKNINIKINNEFLISILSDIQGKFSYNYSIEKIGTYEIFALFNGDDFLNSSSDNKTIFVKDMGTFFDINISKNILKREEELIINGTLYNSKYQKINNSSFKIFYNSKLISSKKTNSKGFLKEIITIPKNSSLGKNIIKLDYNGNNTYGAAEWEKELFIKSDTILKIKSSNNNIHKNQSLKINGLLTDNYNNPVENKTVHLDLKYKETNITTDSNGTFEHTIKLLNNISYGTHHIDAYFNGDEIFLQSQDEIKYNIINPNKKEDNNIILAIIFSILLILSISLIYIIIKKRKTEYDNYKIKDITKVSISNLKNEKNFRKAVLKCYNNICKWLDRSGFKKDRAKTPREFAKDLKEKLDVSDGCLITLTKIFEKACYSEHEVTTNDRDKTLECLNEIKTSLKNKKTEEGK